LEKGARGDLKMMIFFLYKISPNPSLPKRGRGTPKSRRLFGDPGTVALRAAMLYSFGKTKLLLLIGLNLRLNFYKLLILNFALCLFTSCSSVRYETHPGPQYVVASWYGPEFHGRPTASGEVFNMHALTCAHRELPFGTMLKVTSISSGRSVRCIVNDRGPFVPGRDIDLSYAAAREIGLVGPGTGGVTIEYLGRDRSYIKTVRYIASNGPYTIQVGSFREIDNARHLRSSLELKYKGVYIIEAVIGDTRYYRVRIGKFLKIEEAQQLATTMSEEGYSPLIMHYDEQA